MYVLPYRTVQRSRPARCMHMHMAQECFRCCLCFGDLLRTFAFGMFYVAFVLTFRIKRSGTNDALSCVATAARSLSQGVVPQYTRKDFARRYSILLLYEYRQLERELLFTCVCGSCRCGSTTKYCTKECSIHCPIIALASEKLDAHWLIFIIWM